MKKLKIALLLFLTTFFIGCSNNDNSPAPTLAGQWKLINVRGGFIGVNDNFSPGLIKWNVDTANHTVTIVNNNTDPDAQDILESGVYNYVLETDPNSICAETFNVNNLDMGCYTVSATELVITYEYADGFTLTFVR